MATPPAARSSAELTELSKIEGDRERTDKTLTYLRNLPPDPEPLPWETASAPKTDNLTRIAIAGGQIDVAHEPFDASDLTDSIKARLYERLSVGTATVLWTTETIAALEFIQVNKEVILTIATSWGAQGQIWAADLIARSGEALRKYRAKTLTAYPHIPKNSSLVCGRIIYIM